MNTTQHCWLIAVTAALVSTGALAQESSSTETDIKEPLRLGNQVGSFRLIPELNLFYRYDDNIFSLHDQEVSDSVSGVAGSLALVSDWDKHKLDVRAGFESGRYADYHTEDYDDAWASIDGAFATGKSNRILAGLHYSYNHEERGSPDDFFGDEPTQYDSTKAYIGDAFEGDTFIFRTAFSAEVLDYEDATINDGAGSIDNDDRDRTEYELGTRLTHKAGALKPYLQVVFDQRYYDKPYDNYFIVRDSDGYRLGVGSTWDISPALSTDVYVGHIYQYYRDARFKDLSKPQLNASITWQPTRFSQVKFYTENSVEETTLPASGFLYTATGVSLKHQLTPRSYATAHFMIGEEEFQNYDRTDDIVDAGISYRYFLSKHVFLDSGYRFTARDSTAERLGDSSGQSVNDANIQNFDDFHNSVVYLSLGTLLYPAPEDPWPKVRVVQPAFADVDWQGLYIGAELGHGALITDTDGVADSNSDSGPYGDIGSLYGAFAGFGWTFGHWYLGLEGEWQNSDLDIEHNKTKSTAQTISLSRDSATSAALRAGYVVPNGTLLYGKWGRTRVDYNTYNTRNDALALAWDDTEHNWAHHWGIGADIPAGQHLFYRLEYSLTQADDYNIIVFDSSNTLTPVNYDITEPVFNFGIGWQFGQQYEKKRPVVVDHDGFFAGVHVAHGTLASKAWGTHSDSGGGGGTSTFYGDFADLSNENFGVNLGYGMTWRSLFLALEMEGGTSNAYWQHEKEPGGRDFGVEKKGEFAISARLGYVLESGALIYLRGGAVKARFATEWIKGSNSDNWVERDDHIWGDRLGLGAEIPLTNRLSLRLDYSFTNYNTYDFTTSHGGTPDSMNFENSESLFSTGLMITL